MTEFEAHLVSFFTARLGRPADDRVVRMAIAAYSAAHRVLVETWDGTPESYRSGCDQAFAMLSSGLELG